VRLGFAAACCAAFAAACSFAPPYHRPTSAPAPASYQEAGDWKAAEPGEVQPRAPWWTVYGDPVLDALEARVNGANQDLKAALARLDQARAQTRIERSAEFPTVTVDPQVTRQRVSLNAPTYTGGPPVGNDFILGADVSYELDLWGRIRNSVASARATEQASRADVATLELSTHAELATDYFTLRGQDAQQQILDQTVSDYTKALQLTQNLYNGGAAPISDLQQAQAQLETARTQAADIRLRRSQTQHAIAVLVGESASTFQLAGEPLPTGLAPPPLDPGLPSALLERRPDVAAAERRVAAANAGIGVARAAYFPVFSLGATAGFQSTTTSNWISAPSRFWSIGPSAVLTVFDAGLHSAQSAQAHAQYDEQVADYRGTVLTAYQEVEDNLAALRQLQVESGTQTAAVAATQGALEQAQYQYQGGLVTYLQVVVAETTALNARLSALDIQTRRLAASVALVKALGGGWSPSQPVAISR
jgi:NodT family efflux transporter outer membrane factor (OMF) lipoprotein